MKEEKNQLSKMFKRPLPRTKVLPTAAPRVFTTGGRAAGIIEQMKTLNVVGPKSSVWSPPADYEFVAAHLSDREKSEFLMRCQDWYNAHPPREVRVQPLKPVLNLDKISECIAKYSNRRPPCEEYLKALAEAGCTTETLDRVSKHYKWLEDTYEERTKKLDLIFAKWPAANKTSVVKTKTKVIKAVKKKM